MNKRASGVLMHVSSLPGAYGIGCFGKEAKEFIDFLSDTGCTYWQVLPFTPTDAYNSPYASISAFAGNRNFIDLEQLRDEGLLTDDELREQMYANPYSAAFDFLELVNSPHGMNIGMRHISLSTCGVVPGSTRWRSGSFN